MVKWRLKPYLEAHGLTPYELIRRSRLAPNTVYAMARGENRSVRLDTLETVIKTLREVTGKAVSLDDLIEISEDTERIDEQLASEHKAWEAAHLDSDDSPLLEPYDWEDIDPNTLGELFMYSKEHGWITTSLTNLSRHT